MAAAVPSRTAANEPGPDDAIAYRIQEDAYGGLAAAAERQLAKLVEAFESGGNIVASAAAPARTTAKVGTRFIREWHGRIHVVAAVEGGFEHLGRIYPSLTAIAVAITGARWSGPRFFGLVRRKGATAEDRRAAARDRLVGATGLSDLGGPSDRHEAPAVAANPRKNAGAEMINA